MKIFKKQKKGVRSKEKQTERKMGPNKFTNCGYQGSLVKTD